MIINVIEIALSVLVGYLLGSFNAGIIVSHALYKQDVRDFGSKNAGLTNVLRTYGKKAAAITLLLDFLKGIIACLLPYLIVFLAIGDKKYGVLAVLGGALGAVLGHNWPVYFGFKGGKGVLCSFSVMLFIAPLPALIALGVFIVVVALTRYVSLGSILAAASFPFAVYFIGGWLPETKGLTVTLIVSTIIVLMLIVRHGANIKRLLHGNESKLSFKK